MKKIYHQQIKLIQAVFLYPEVTYPLEQLHQIDAS
jgi:hypothetical protein